MTTPFPAINCKTYSSSFFNKDKESRLIVLGRTGDGKSELGNLLLGRQEFKTACSAGSVTRQSARASTFFNGQKLLVSDTPGLFDTTLSNEQISTEITHTLYDCAPGPHAFLIVTTGRQTAEAEKTLTLLIRLFGAQVVHYCIVVVTHEDDLTEDEITLQEYLGDANSPLRNFVEKCGGRCIAVNSKTEVSEERSKKLNELLRYVDEIARSNQTPYFTDENFQQAAIDEAQRLQEEEENRRKDLGEDDIRRRENADLQQREEQVMHNRQTYEQNIQESTQTRDEERRRRTGNTEDGAGVGTVFAVLCYVVLQVVCATKNQSNPPASPNPFRLRPPSTTLNLGLNFHGSFGFGLSRFH